MALARLAELAVQENTMRRCGYDMRRGVAAIHTHVCNTLCRDSFCVEHADQSGLRHLSQRKRGNSSWGVGFVPGNVNLFFVSVFKLLRILKKK